MQINNQLKSLIWIIVILITTGKSQAQPKQQPRNTQIERLFTGLWINKKSTRHLEISFDNGYVTITDWTSKFQKRESGDIYKASLKNGKLIMPEDTRHRAPYCEILYKNDTLIYLSKPIAATNSSQWDKQVFTRSVSRSQ